MKNLYKLTRLYSDGLEEYPVEELLVSAETQTDAVNLAEGSWDTVEQIAWMTGQEQTEGVLLRY